MNHLLNYTPTNYIFLKTFNSQCLYIEVWFMDHNSKPLEIEEKVNLSLVSNCCVTYKTRYSIEPREFLLKTMNFFLNPVKNVLIMLMHSKLLPKEQSKKQQING